MHSRETTTSAAVSTNKTAVDCSMTEETFHFCRINNITILPVGREIKNNDHKPFILSAELIICQWLGGGEEYPRVAFTQGPHLQWWTG